MTQDFAADLLILAVRMLTHGTVLFVLTWLLCLTVFGNARPAVRCLLWTVVLIKFLLPPILPGELSLSSWLSRISFSSAASEAAATLEMVTVDSAALSAVSAASASTSLLFSWQMYLLAAYLLVAAGFALHWVYRSLQLGRHLRSLPLAGGGLRQEAMRLAGDLRIRRRVTVRLEEKSAGAPYVTGLFTPTLVLPRAIVEELEPSTRRALILHELAHIRRGDLMVRWVQNLGRVLLFFWPPLWWACRRIERYSEMACDELAVNLSRVRPEAYARSLLEIVKRITSSPMPGQQLAFAQRGDLLEERFEMILKSKKTPARFSWVLAVLLAGWTFFAMAGGASWPQQEKQVKKEKVVVKSGESELPAELLQKYPEADANGDGVLTAAELKEHLGDGKFSFKIIRREGDHGGEGAGVRVFSTGQSIEGLLERFPEADSNGDGSLDPEELRNYIKQHEGPQAVFIGEDHGRGGNVFIASEGRLQEADFDLIVGSLDEIRSLHPEADINGDGELTREELQEWGSAHAREHGRFAVKIESDAGDEETADVFVWKFGEDADWTSDSGEKVVIKVRKHEGEEGGEHAEVRTIVVQRHQDGEELTAEALQGRGKRLLEKYPEADLDGDGELSKDEAQALASKLQKEKQKSKGKKKNQ